MSQSDWRQQLSEINPPYLSIVVPVYNTEQYLRSCLISVVFQTLPETEVIVVNDASPDNSQVIIDEFVQKFPDRVRCIVHDHNQGLAYARRSGLNAANAPYVLFVDSDDFISGQLGEDLLKDIVSRELDIDFFPILRCWIENGKREVLKPPQKEDKETFIRDGYAAFCGAIFRKEFLLQQSEIAFIPMLYEDAAAMPALISRAKRVGSYTPKNYYFYRYERQGSICSQQISNKKIHDSFQANFIGIKNVCQTWKSSYEYRMLKRACAIYRNEPSVHDYAVFHVKEALRLCEYHKEDFSPVYQKNFETIQRRPDHILIPKIVYLNGFMRDQIVNFSRYQAEAEKAYLFAPEIKTIDANICDMNNLPVWLSDHSEEEKGLYFILKEIVTNGGMYIAPTVRVTTSFNREAFRSAFFVSGGSASVLMCAFGGEKDSFLLSQILKIVEAPSVRWKRNSIADCIAHVLIAECGVHLDGREEFAHYGLHMIAFSDVVRSINPKQSYSILDYSNLKYFHEEVISLPFWMNEFAWECAQKAASVQRKNAASNSYAEQELKKIKSTRLFKIAKKIYYFIPRRLRIWLWK